MTWLPLAAVNFYNIAATMPAPIKATGRPFLAANPAWEAPVMVEVDAVPVPVNEVRTDVAWVPVIVAFWAEAAVVVAAIAVGVVDATVVDLPLGPYPGRYDGEYVAVPL
jgi:hypothetical protein